MKSNKEDCKDCDERKPCTTADNGDRICLECMMIRAFNEVEDDIEEVMFGA